MLLSRVDLTLPRYKRLASLSALTVLGLAEQSIGPDEIHTQAFAYVPPASLTLRTQANLVEVPVVVRDGQKRAVDGLTREDFQVYDAGKKQTITAFSKESFTPRGAAAKEKTGARFVALVMDDLHTGAASLKAAKDAAERFVETSLAPGDQVVVVTTSASASYEFTADVPKLVDEISKVRPHTQNDAGACPAFSPYQAYVIVNDLDPEILGQKMRECYACLHIGCPLERVTALATMVWEPARISMKNTLAAIENLVDGMSKAPGQRIVLLTSAELLTGEVEADIDRLMGKALHAEVIINTLDAEGLTTMPRAAETDAMAALADGTGGSFYHNNNDLLEGFRELGMAPETMYIIGFTPSDQSADGRFHALKVQLAGGKRYSVRARLGYKALPAKAVEPEVPLSKLDSEVLAPDTPTDLPIRFTWEQRAGPPNITMVMHLDVGSLHFEAKNNCRAQKLTIVVVLTDQSGGFVTGQRIEFSLNLTDATYVQLTKTDFSAALPLKAPPGNYIVRAVAQDAEGKFTAANEKLEVR